MVFLANILCVKRIYLFYYKIYNHFIAKTFYNQIWQIPVKTKIKDLP